MKDFRIPFSFVRKPLVSALLVAFSTLAVAVEPMKERLPDLGEPAAPADTLEPALNAQGGGVTWKDSLGDTRVKLIPEYSEQTGFALGGSIATPLGDHGAAGALLTAGGDKKEILLNVGVDFAARQRLLLTLGQLRQTLKFNFISGEGQADLTQNSGAASYQYLLGDGLFNSIEVNGYLADTGSRDLTDKTYVVETATLFELWNDPRRIAGGRVTGLQGRLVLAPVPGGTLRLGVGAERIRYDMLAGRDTKTRASGSAEWKQRLDSGFTVKAGVNAAGAQDRYSLGFGRSIGSGQLDLDLTAIRGRDNAPDDNLIQISYTYVFGAGGRGGPAGDSGGTMPKAAPATTATPARNPDWRYSLLDEVAQRPSYIPSQVVARVDTSAAPVRLIAVDKAVLPAGSSVSNSGLITAPVGATAIDIASVTLNGGAFTNSGQFTLSGNNLVVNPSLITQPAVGVTDTYVVTINTPLGGTTLATVVVTHGSVKIDSVAMSIGPSAPLASNVSISGTAQVGQTLTGGYTYADPNGDTQGASTFRWLRNGVAIAGATATTYTLVNADYNTTITFEVTPVATVAPVTGTAIASSATAAVTLPTGYVSYGGLVWTPNNAGPWPGGYIDWSTANTYCSTATILGQSGWRLPTTPEMQALALSGALAGQGWVSGGGFVTWSSTVNGTGHDSVYLANGLVVADSDVNYRYVTCVR